MSAPLRWSIAAGVITAAAVLVLVIPLLAREPLDRIEVRSVPRQVAPATMPVPAPPATTSAAAPLAWTLPAGWSPAPAKTMRLAVFAVDLGGGASGECGVFLFPGGGDRLANVNRWRGQVGLPPVEADALERELATDTCAFGPFAWATIRGDGKAFLVAMLVTPAGQGFVKLEAPPERLDSLRDGFLAFCRSLRPAATP